MKTLDVVLYFGLSAFLGTTIASGMHIEYGVFGADFCVNNCSDTAVSVHECVHESAAKPPPDDCVDEACFQNIIYVAACEVVQEEWEETGCHTNTESDALIGVQRERADTDCRDGQSDPTKWVDVDPTDCTHFVGHSFRCIKEDACDGMILGTTGAYGVLYKCGD